ncbi:hypothetical protein Tco_0823834 [Tanacetum coccineum]|uniref:Integrase, catalytic region, zinc finger, CCHC-type, peptidase aspartic, catalytic n=1 Tax=Tanacetum coccineum TaxID=301880 RepID=A0ABQ5AJ13_9ASTR
MLDRTDFESWQQRIRLYCLGKDNGENIMKSITEGPFQMGTIRDTLTEGGEGALHLGPERARVFADLSAKQKDRYNAFNQGQTILGGTCKRKVVAGNALRSYRDWQWTTSKTKMLLMIAHENGVVLDEEQLLFLAGEQVTNFNDDVDDLALNVDDVFEADQCDAFESDVDEAPTIQTMFMVNLSSKIQSMMKPGRSYDSILRVLSHEMRFVVNILNSMNATSTVKIVLNKGKQIWKPKKDKLYNNSIEPDKAGSGMHRGNYLLMLVINGDPQERKSP